MRKAYFLGIISVVLLGFLTGCRTSVNTVENAEKSGVRQPVEDKRVITDKSLKISVTALNERTAANGFKQIQFELTNASNYDRSVFYKVEWYNEDAMLITTGTGGWVEKPFVARESISVVATAPSAMAKDFRIKLVNRP